MDNQMDNQTSDSVVVLSTEEWRRLREGFEQFVARIEMVEDMEEALAKVRGEMDGASLLRAKRKALVDNLKGVFGETRAFGAGVSWARTRD